MMQSSPRQHLLSRLNALIEQRVGLARSATSDANLEALLETASGGSPGAFIRALESTTEQSPQWQQLLRALMIGETYFLRNRVHLNWLRQIILPQLLHHDSASITIWSAGCATGEELYSLAVTLHESLSDAQRRRIRLIGTDLNLQALEAAKRGLYRPWSFRHTEATFQQYYFDVSEHGLLIKPFIRQMVTLLPRNLLAGAPVNPVDLIICANVLLYFTEDSIRRVEDAFFEALRPGGWLLLGQAEAIRFARDRWQVHLFPGGVAYQKPVTSAASSSAIYHAPPPATAVTRHQNIAAATENAPAGLYADAVRAVRQRDYPEAERLLRRILSLTPDDGPAHVLMSCILANEGHFDDAQAEADMALTVNPLLADAHFLKGALYLDMRQISAAQDALRSALYCQRAHPLASMVLGNLYMSENKPEQARRVWNAALAELEDSPADQFVSEISDLTVAHVREFLLGQLSND
ncbi:MAG: hypothetical protein J0L63_11285 [Anaerolineae bacterium]|nr:hypothetical protein [Anaerolineae bacterium]